MQNYDKNQRVMLPRY